MSEDLSESRFEVILRFVLVTIKTIRRSDQLSRLLGVSSRPQRDPGIWSRSERRSQT